MVLDIPNEVIDELRNRISKGSLPVGSQRVFEAAEDLVKAIDAGEYGGQVSFERQNLPA